MHNNNDRPLITSPYCRCLREQQGRDPSETCDKCKASGIQCVTIKRKVRKQLPISTAIISGLLNLVIFTVPMQVGRQPGSKNRAPSKRKLSQTYDDRPSTSPVAESSVSDTPAGETEHLPNPLHVLGAASEARRLHSGDE